MALLEQRQNASRCADLQSGGKRTHVGIADQEMKAPIFSVISQRLIPRIDDSAIELHPLINVVDDMIGTLTELKIDLYLWLRRLKIECQRIRLADSTGASEDLPRGQKSEERSENRRCELRLPFHQVILVATKCGSGMMIDIILDKRHATLRTQGGEGRLEQVVTG